MSDKEIIVFPRGQLSAKDKERLTKAGLIAIEADSPSSVTRIRVSEPLVLSQTLVTGDAILSSLLIALAGQRPANGSGFITEAGLACHSFVKALAAALPKEPQP